MSSQDTLNSAQSEEENARILQTEIDKEQADIQALQKDINQKSDVITGLQQRMQAHLSSAQNLREKAVGEQKIEQEEQLREQQKANEQGVVGAAKQGVINNLF